MDWLPDIEKLWKNKLTKYLENITGYDELKGCIYELEIKFNCDIDNFELSLKSDCIINYCKESKVLRLNLGKSGYGRYERATKIEKLEALRIFVDTSSIEVFVNYGEEVFTSRIYCADFDDKISMKGNLDDVKINLYELGEYKYV